VNSNEPAGLPRGTVRAIITVLLLLMCGASMFIPIVEGAGEVRGALLALAGVATKSYFDIRSEQNTEDGPPLGEPYVNDAS
jgi:hypothetical protein